MAAASLVTCKLILEYLDEWTDSFYGFERQVDLDCEAFYGFRAKRFADGSECEIHVEKAVGTDGFVNAFVKEEGGRWEWIDAIAIYPA